MDDVIYIADKPALHALCRQLRQCSWLAVDTEFIREKTYYPRLALVQIADAERIYCIDPLAIDDLAALYDLLENPQVTKVLHAASQDLEIFFYERQRVAQPVFDTQVAASMLGLGEQIGYASLVKQLLQLELDKSHTRTDWMQRPLSMEQIRYAADDVRYLRQIYPLLHNKLEKLNRIDWLNSEMTRLLDPASYQPDPLNSWQRVKGAGKLSSKQLNVLKHLAAWRERQAIQSDRPRRWILPDEALLSLVTQCPASQEQLLTIRLLDNKTGERHGKKLLELITEAQHEPQAAWPVMLKPKKPSSEEKAAVDRLMAVAELRAAEYQLDPGQITSRSELLKLIRGEQNLSILNGWRRQIAGQSILDMIQGKLQLVCDQNHTALKSK